MKAEEKLIKLKFEIERQNKEISLLEEKLQQFPDLEIHVNRWKTERYSAKSANPLVNKWHSGYSCGCCDDAGLQIYFYHESEDGIKIHSNPDHFYIGEKSYYSPGGNRVDPGFEEQMIAANINPELIKKVRSCYEDREESSDMDYEDGV